MTLAVQSYKCHWVNVEPRAQFTLRSIVEAKGCSYMWIKQLFEAFRSNLLNVHIYDMLYLPMIE